MEQTPKEINKISDSTLLAFVDTFLLRAITQQHNTPPLPAAIEPFITAEVMLRLHNLVASARSCGRTGSWSKKATLAGVVASFTGVRVKQCDAEHIGNAQDTFLRNYCYALTVAKMAFSTAKSKAKRLGREPAGHFQESSRRVE
ncbi:MAG: hypothetical protein SGPRY_008203 [Prymnesium sp.]